MKLKKIQNMFKRMIVILLINTIFIAYIVPISIATATKSYNGEYSTISAGNKEILVRILKQAKWEEFKNIDLSGGEIDGYKLIYGFRAGTGEIKESEVSEGVFLYSVELPNEFLEWIENDLKLKELNFSNIDFLQKSNEYNVFPRFDLYFPSVNKINMQNANIRLKQFGGSSFFNCFECINAIDIKDSVVIASTKEEGESSFVWNSDKFINKPELTYKLSEEDEYIIKNDLKMYWQFRYTIRRSNKIYK